MKIMLLGSNGQLGRELESQLSTVSSVFAFPKSALNITNKKEVYEAVLDTQPDLIVNAAAYTSVDGAEKDKKGAHSVNAESVAHIAQLAKEKKALLIHYSTDYVFDGTKSNPYCENDTTNPINFYGMSKLAGERAIIDSNCQFLIFRASWVIGKDGHNFAKTILRLVNDYAQVKIVCDQIGVPTSTMLISKVTVDAIRAFKKNRSWPQGVYHLAPRGVTNWFEIAQILIELAKNHHFLQSNNSLDIQAVKTSEYLTLAKRPLNSLLNTQKLQSQLSFDLPFWKDDFFAIANDLIKELQEV